MLCVVFLRFELSCVRKRGVEVDVESDLFSHRL